MILRSILDDVMKSAWWFYNKYLMIFWKVLMIYDKCLMIWWPAMTSGRIQQLYNGHGSSGSGTASAREHDATSTGENHYDYLLQFFSWLWWWGWFFISFMILLSLIILTSLIIMMNSDDFDDCNIMIILLMHNKLKRTWCGSSRLQWFWWLSFFVLAKFHEMMEMIINGDQFVTANWW